MEMMLCCTGCRDVHFLALTGGQHCRMFWFGLTALVCRCSFWQPHTGLAAVALVKSPGFQKVSRDRRAPAQWVSAEDAFDRQASVERTRLRRKIDQ